MTKLFGILRDIAIIIVIMAFSYIMMNYKSIFIHVKANVIDSPIIIDTNIINTQINNNSNKFIIYDNSDSVKGSKENNIYNGYDTLENLSIVLNTLLLVSKDTNNEINIQLEEKREDILKDQTFSNNKTYKEDDFFSLSFDMSNEEKTKYGKESFIVIPNIGVSAPIAYPSIEDPKLEDNILKLLEKGIVHRPETQLPYQKGNFFLLGHSSNYAWIQSDYNNIFAKLDFLSVGDEVYVYYKSRKYIYQLKEKKIVDPNAIEVYGYIPGYNLSIMTCRPIGSVKSRLIAIFELKKNGN